MLRVRLPCRAALRLCALGPPRTNVESVANREKNIRAAGGVAEWIFSGFTF